MKNLFLKLACCLGLFFSICFAASAQKTLTASVGNWVVETNVHQKDFTIVSFYDANNTLLYQEKLQGVCLDVRRRKTQKMLNTTLLNIVQSKPIANKYFKGTPKGKAVVKT